MGQSETIQKSCILGVAVLSLYSCLAMASALVAPNDSQTLDLASVTRVVASHECNVTQEQLDAVTDAAGTYEITVAEFCELGAHNANQ